MTIHKVHKSFIFYKNSKKIEVYYRKATPIYLDCKLMDQNPMGIPTWCIPKDTWS